MTRSCKGPIFEVLQRSGATVMSCRDLLQGVPAFMKLYVSSLTTDVSICLYKVTTIISCLKRRKKNSRRDRWRTNRVGTSSKSSTGSDSSAGTSDEKRKKKDKERKKDKKSRGVCIEIIQVCVVTRLLG